MTFEQAVDLAREVEQTKPRFVVVAIGRFVAVDQLQSATKWGVSVLPIDSPTGKPVVIWEADGWIKIGGRTITQPRPDAKHRQQMTLF